MVRRYGLRDDQWEKREGLLPGRDETVGGTAKENRLFVEAVFSRYRAGIPWRDLPERFGDFRVIHTRHTRGSTRGGWKRVFERLAHDPDTEDALLDSTIGRTHQHSAGAKRGDRTTECSGRSKGGLTTKIHAPGEALGNSTGFHLTPGQAHDLAGADALLPGMDANTIIADNACDADERVIEPLRKAGKTIVIPPKANRTVPRPYDEDLYKARHLIENFCATLKQFRALVTRYDKRATNFLGARALAASITWLK
ncbi:MAG: IS5 family transposase [Nitrospira sp.]